MQWSITVGKVFGISIRLHVTFILLLIWIGIGDFLRGGTAAAITGLVFILAIFGSVLLHEFGHALAARKYGIKTPDITLLPIGGVARIERLPDEPRQELVVAIAGPMVNVVISIILYIVLSTMNPGTFVNGVSGMGFFAGHFLMRLLSINVWLVLFNLIPAFPMDGGRVLRALLASRLGVARATQIAASVGQAIAFIFVLLGFFGNPFLIFIGLFVYLGAAGEVPAAQMRELTRGLTVENVMVTRFQPFRPEDSLSSAIDALLAGADKEFPVIDHDGTVAGILCREDIVRALSARGPHSPIGAAMQRVPVAHQDEMLEQAFERMSAGKYPALPVVNAHGRLVGLLTRENIAEVMMLYRAGRSYSS